MQTLIVYGTRYGATAGTAEEIAKVLREEGFTVTVVNAKDNKVATIEEYDLVIVGSGMKIDQWTAEPERFLRNFKHELAEKKLAVFVSSAIQAVYQFEGNTEAIERAQKKYLEEKMDKYSLTPVSLTIFGGIFPYDTLGWMTRKTVGQLWRKFEEAGYIKENGAYDTRDWTGIRQWAKELAEKSR